MACRVDMMASRRSGTLSLCVTNDLARRAREHRTKPQDVFSARHDVTRLVRHEALGDVREAIAGERMLEKWRRAWKLRPMEERTRPRSIST